MQFHAGPFGPKERRLGGQFRSVIADDRFGQGPRELAYMAGEPLPPRASRYRVVRQRFAAHEQYRTRLSDTQAPHDALTFNERQVTEVGFGSILLKNPVSAQGRKISGDMARLDREVPRAYLPTAIVLRESSRIASARTCPQLSLSIRGRRKSARCGKPSFSTE
jgi:hypothetical protein